MIYWLLARLIHTVLVLVGVASLVFVLMRMLPGDPVELMAGESANVLEREAMFVAMGLDKPLPQQWLEYVAALAQGDFGHSLYSGRPVLDDIAERLPATIALAVCAMAVAMAVAVPLGIMAALKARSVVGHAATAFSLLGVAIPNFWLGPMLILCFSYHLWWFPVSGYDEPLAWVLPALTLGMGMAAIQTGMLRQSLLEQLQSDYLLAARARGLSVLQGVLRHALRIALLPVLTVFGLQLGALLTGVVVTERIFAWPGLGSLLVNAISARDYPVVQGCVMLISLLYIVVNMMTDIGYRYFDPRIGLYRDTKR
ncbi:MAG: ABC transporter permease [Candidatus Porifericomitaceae bacterium WSBS_2022_MAG_OTU9]